jgi:hypothetical protein
MILCKLVVSNACGILTTSETLSVVQCHFTLRWQMYVNPCGAFRQWSSLALFSWDASWNWIKLAGRRSTWTCRFRSGVVEVSFLLICHSAWPGKWIPTFRDNILLSSSLLKMRPIALFRKVGNRLPSDVASCPEERIPVTNWMERNV